jgi:hypothetical protein
LGNLGATSYSLSYDAENRLSSVSGSGSVTFWYDGDGKRVKATQGGATTTYIGDYFEWDGATARVYYYAGGQRIGTRPGTGTVSYILSDNLGSTSVTLDSSQGTTAETRYKAYGEDYTTSGTHPTTFRFTGQRLDTHTTAHDEDAAASRSARGGLSFSAPLHTRVPNPGAYFAHFLKMPTFLSRFLATHSSA